MTPPRRKGATEETTTCPWCSAAVPVSAATCPSCGAALRDQLEGDLPGVTQIDPEAILEMQKARRGRGGIGAYQGVIAAFGVGDGGETDEQVIRLAGETTIPGGKVEPPSAEVRAEMLRLELAALDAEIEAKRTQAEANRDLPPEDGTAPTTPPSPPAADDKGDAEATSG